MSLPALGIYTHDSGHFKQVVFLQEKKRDTAVKATTLDGSTVKFSDNGRVDDGRYSLVE
jgi:hypothetical protein